MRARDDARVGRMSQRRPVCTRTSDTAGPLNPRAVGFGLQLTGHPIRCRKPPVRLSGPSAISVHHHGTFQVHRPLDNACTPQKGFKPVNLCDSSVSASGPYNCRHCFPLHTLFGLHEISRKEQKSTGSRVTSVRASIVHIEPQTSLAASGVRYKVLVARANRHKGEPDGNTSIAIIGWNDTPSSRSKFAVSNCFRSRPV